MTEATPGSVYTVQNKEAIRQSLSEDESMRPAGLSTPDRGKVAERLRRMLPYRTARRVLVSLGPSLQQLRLNVLADRKELVFPTPGLQKGFTLLRPESVPISKRLLAVRLYENNPFARKIPFDKPLEVPIDLIVTDALAATRNGDILGNGQGNLDLQTAILQFLGWLAPTARIVVVLGEHRIFDILPTEVTDIGANWIVTPENSYETSRKNLPETSIHWDLLHTKRIRRNDGLFYIFRTLAL